MVSTFTPNINLEEPGRGDQVGVWDTPVNADTTVIDLCLGGIATISLNNANVVLAAAQFQSEQITFNSTLTGSVNITFPTSFHKSYVIYHTCTGSSAFTITLATTAAGGQTIACPPGELFECRTDGTNVRFKNFGGRVGTYMDYAGSSTPNWNDICTVPPYRNCDGTAVSSTTHPVLYGLIGATLPDSRGSARAAVNQGTGRLTAGISGVNGDTLFARGGAESVQAHTHVNALNDPHHSHFVGVFNGAGTPGSAGIQGTANANNTDTGSGQALITATNMTITNASFGAGGSQNVQPTYAGGLTLIRAA